MVGLLAAHLLLVVEFGEHIPTGNFCVEPDPKVEQGNLTAYDFALPSQLIDGLRGFEGTGNKVGFGDGSGEVSGECEDMARVTVAGSQAPGLFGYPV